MTSPRLFCHFPQHDTHEFYRNLFIENLSRAGQPISDHIPDMGSMNTAMYIATANEDEEVIVKFTQASRYNKVAHIVPMLGLLRSYTFVSLS